MGSFNGNHLEKAPGAEVGVLTMRGLIPRFYSLARKNKKSVSFYININIPRMNEIQKYKHTLG